MSASSVLPIGPMPIRIDGAPSGSGAAPTQPGAPSQIVIGSPPSILDIDITYGASNKADARAAWAPPSQPGSESLSAIEGYEYEWRFCSGGACRQVARGSTDAQTFQVSVDLPSGPGTYEFAVRARVSVFGTSGVTPFATQRFTQLSSRAAPPNNVLLAVRDGDAEVVWEKAAIRKGLAPKYEVQVRNVSTNGKWKTFNLTAGDTLRFKASEIGLNLDQVAQARVRTVLNNGQTSTFIASNEYTYTPSEFRPVVRFAHAEGSSLLLMAALNPNRYFSSYPEFGYQARIAYLDGPWITLRLSDTFVTDVAPRDGIEVRSPTVIPYQITVPLVGFTLPPGAGSEDVRLQVRGVSAGERFPSPWWDAPIRVLR